jgi:hypothetical protein
MIDTDKYEGHTPAPWKWFAERPLEVALIGDLNSCADTEGGSWYILDRSAWGEDPNQDALLIADAPKLLAEVKRLGRMADELIAIWEILEEDYPHVDRAIVKELVERKIGDYEVIE